MPGSPDIVDAHVHLWDLSARDQPWIGPDSPIRRSYDTTDLHDAIGISPVASVVLVQVANDAHETDELIATSARDRLIAGVVGWADLTQSALADRIGQLDGTGQLVGIRHQLQAERNPTGWLTQPAVIRGLGILERSDIAFDLMIRPAQFDAARAAVRRHPSLRFVLDHIGKPLIAAGRLEPWASGLRALAAEDNVSCKLSGMVTVADPQSWTVADIRPYTDIVLDAFGPARLMFGTDWPVSTLVAGYSRVIEVAQAVCDDLSADELARVMAGTARSWYRLGPDS